MFIKRPMFFAEGEDEKASALSGQDLDVPELTIEGEEKVATPEPEQQATPTFKPEDMATTFAEAIKKAGLVPAPAPEVRKELTPEEAKKLLNVWEPTDEWLAKYDNLETRKAAIAEQHAGQLKQFDTILQLRLKSSVDQINQDYAPIRQYVTEREAVAREEKFNSEYPDLAKPELKPLIATVITSLGQQGILKPGDDPHNFKMIAGALESVIRQGNPDFKLSPKGSTPSGQTRNNNALKPTSSGSGGGGGGKAAAPTKTGNKVLDLLG